MREIGLSVMLVNQAYSRSYPRNFLSLSIASWTKCETRPNPSIVGVGFATISFPPDVLLHDLHAYGQSLQPHHPSRLFLGVASREPIWTMKKYTDDLYAKEIGRKDEKVASAVSNESAYVFGGFI